MLNNIYRRMCDRRETYRGDYKSLHWDVFDQHFDDCLRDPERMRIFRRCGMTHGVETGLLVQDRADVFASSLPVDAHYSTHDQQDVEMRYGLLVDMCGETFFSKVTETQVGDPVVHAVNGLRLNIDDLFIVYAAFQVARVFEALERKPKRIVEIGGGYGSLAFKLSRLYPQCRIDLIDLPEGLAVQEYYLSTLLGTGANMPDEIHTHVAWDLSGLADANYDLIVNSRSFGEMNTSIIGRYFDFIHGALKPGGVFYNVNRYATIRTGTVIRYRDFPYDDYWNVLLSQPQWLQTHLHEMMTLRRETANPFGPAFMLRTFPAVSPPSAPGNPFNESNPSVLSYLASRR